MQNSENLLRNYLRKSGARRDENKHEEFDAFLVSVSKLFALRSASEEYFEGSPKFSTFDFKEHKYLAKNSKNALPLEWEDVCLIINPSADNPPETIVTFAAKQILNDLSFVSDNFRKILTRNREKTPISKAQMVDAACLRWLMKQPGRTVSEKAGTSQRVLTVIRKENFDIIENKVFKDLVLRLIPIANSYLKEYRSTFPRSNNIKLIQKLLNLCTKISKTEEFQIISELHSLPKPNYVLLQDIHYGKLWRVYLKVIQFNNFAVKLWRRRCDLERTLSAISEDAEKRTILGFDNLKYHSMLWVKPLDGENDFVEKAELTHPNRFDIANETLLLQRLREKDFPFLLDKGCFVIDLTGNHRYYHGLYDKPTHENSKPIVFRETYPPLSLMEQKPIELSEILNSLKNDKSQISLLRDFARGMIGDLKSKTNTNIVTELIILIPDDYDALLQETILDAFSFIGRSKIHLLWRSIATALGYKSLGVNLNEIKECGFLDFREDGTALLSVIKWKGTIPQRATYRGNSPRYKFYENACTLSQSDFVGMPIILSGNVPSTFLNDFFPRTSDGFEIFSENDTVWLQRLGAEVFHKSDKGAEILYYDELESLWFIGQDNHNNGRVIGTVIVQGQEDFPGGRVHTQPLNGELAIQEGTTPKIDFYLHFGSETTIDNIKLHKYAAEIASAQELHNPLPLQGTISLSPGQGIAIITIFKNQILQEELTLDYINNLKLSDDSIASLQENLNKQNFPPSSAIVEPYSAAYFRNHYPPAPGDVNEQTWYDIKVKTMKYIRRELLIGSRNMPQKLFYLPRRKNGQNLGINENITHILDRWNIFGTLNDNNRPEWLSARDEERLIEKLITDYRNNREPAKCLRILAWTYNSRHPEMKRLVSEILEEYESRKTERGCIQSVKISLLANCLPPENSTQEIQKKKCVILNTFQERLGRGNANQLDFRLIYNILQFNPDIFRRLNFSFGYVQSVMEGFVQTLEFCYEEENSMRCYYALRALLYFLRIRECHWGFLREFEQNDNDENWAFPEIYQTLNCILSVPFPKEVRYPTNKLRSITLDYINGSGNLEKLLSIQSGDEDDNDNN